MSLQKILKYMVYGVTTLSVVALSLLISNKTEQYAVREGDDLEKPSYFSFAKKAYADDGDGDDSSSWCGYGDGGWSSGGDGDGDCDGGDGDCGA